MMDKYTKLLSILIFFALLIPGVTKAQTTNQSTIQLVNVPTDLIINQETTVGVMIENAPMIYGADVRLSFDANILEVVDSDVTQGGIQFASGDFLDPEQGFELQHVVNNTSGTIDYAISLLNPASPAQGSGLLLEITFRAKTDGQATLSVDEGLFGTQTGETISPELDRTTFDVVSNPGNGTIESDESLLGDNLPEGNSVAKDEIGNETGNDPKINAAVDNNTRIPTFLIILGVVSIFIVGLFSGKLMGRT